MTRAGRRKSQLDEIHQINRRFLELIAMRACNDKSDVYGLPADLCRQIAGLSGVQRDIMAVVPLLLVTAKSHAISEASAVRDEEMTEPQEYMRIDVAEQNFTTALMTWLTRGDQQEHTLASLWQGDAGIWGRTRPTPEFWRNSDAGALCRRDTPGSSCGPAGDVD